MFLGYKVQINSFWDVNNSEMSYSLLDSFKDWVAGLHCGYVHKFQSKAWAAAHKWLLLSCNLKTLSLHPNMCCPKLNCGCYLDSNVHK